jgi:hypothetical protein
LVSKDGKDYCACGGCLSLSEAKKEEEKCKKEGFFSTLKPCRKCGRLVFEAGFRKKKSAEFMKENGLGTYNPDSLPICIGSCG